MLKKVFFLGGILLAGQAYGQTASPLQQVISSNSLLDRPPIFQEMQQNIGQELGSTEPGLRVEYVYQNMGKVRMHLLNTVDSLNIEVKISSQDTIRFTITYGKDKSFSIDTPANGVLATILDNFERKLPSELKNSVLKFEGLFKDNHKTQKAVVAGIVMVLDEKRFAPGVRLSSDNSINSLAAIFGKIVRGFIDDAVSDKSVLDLYEKLPTQEDQLKERVNEINKLLQNRIKKSKKDVQEKLVKYLDQSEYRITKVFDEFSRVLVALNSGLSIRGGEKKLSGGTHISFTTREDFQIGIYTNWQLDTTKVKIDPKDSTQVIETTPSESLAGLQVRWYLRNKFQVDLLASTLFGSGRGSGKYNFGEVWEFGGGIGGRYRKVILGGAYFHFHTTKPGIKNTHSFGVTVKYATPSSPTLFIGSNDKAKDSKFFIQISYPIPVTTH